MARRKQLSPMQRIPSGEVMQDPSTFPDAPERYMNGHSERLHPKSSMKRHERPIVAVSAAPVEAGLVQLVICVAGIYASLYVNPQLM